MSDDDPFALLGLPRSYAVDVEALETAYRRRAAALHPDRHLDPIDQADAAEQTARINDARAILLDDERRANVLLALCGGPPSETDKTLPDGFLVEMMERREAMADVLAKGDDTEIASMETWAQSQRDGYRASVASQFERCDEHDAAALAAIRRELNAWRYIERMIEQLDPSHEHLL
jgi:molecular chaperone HscB